MTPQPCAPPGVSRLVVVICLLLAMGPAVFADTDRPPIAGITVRNNLLLSSDYLTEALGLREGQEFDNEALRRTVRDWNETAGLGTISYRIEPASGGAVELLLDVDERVRITSVSFEGNRRISARRLRRVVGLQPGDTVGRYELRAAEQAIEDAYRQRGFPIVSVSTSLEVVEQERRLLFRVEEGPRAHVRSIVFEGNEHISDGTLRRQMESRRRRWPRLFWPGWFERATFEADILRVRTYYRNQGFLDAEVTGEALFDEEGERVTLQLRVEEGPLYTVGDVEITGNRLFRTEELLEAIPLEVGGPYRPPLMEQTVETVTDLYARQGHMDVTLRKGNLAVEPVFPPVGTEVTVNIRITEGEAVYIRRVEIRGLTKTREDVVRREILMHPGERASSEKLRESERRLLNTGFFDREAPQPVRIDLEPDEGTLRDAVVRVQEGPTGRLMMGAGWGSEAGLIGEIAMTEDNFDITNWPSSWNDLWRGNAFRGGGQQLMLMLRIGTERSYYSLSWRNPAVFNTDYSFGASLYRTGIARIAFDETRSGLTVEGGQELSPYVRRDVTLGYETIDISGISPTSSAEILRDRGTHRKPFVRLGASVDRRDNRFVPKEGYLVRGELELAARDVQTAKLELEGRKYWTVYEPEEDHKHVVGVRGKIGMMDAYSGRRIPVFERYYAGGLGTLRGFEFEGVAPVDPVTGEQIGGEAKLLGSVEYSLPLVPPDRLRLITFADGGYVTEELKDVLSGWDELRLSAGLGLRWQIPALGAVLDVSLGWPLRKERDDVTQTLHFSLGAERRF